MAYQMEEIAVVENSVTNRMDADWGDVTSKIRLLSDYSGGFKGLEEFSHIVVITCLHEATFIKEKHLQRHPRNIKTLPKTGIFSQRAKNRPNSIGMTSVEIVDVEGDVLQVKGLDAINGTPVLDIKPYFPQYDKKEGVRVPQWVNALMKNYF